jgi:hypothetical protein
MYLFSSLCIKAAEIYGEQNFLKILFPKRFKQKSKGRNSVMLAVNMSSPKYAQVT